MISLHFLKIINGKIWLFLVLFFWIFQDLKGLYRFVFLIILRLILIKKLSWFLWWNQKIERINWHFIIVDAWWRQIKIFIERRAVIAISWFIGVGWWICILIDGFFDIWTYFMFNHLMLSFTWFFGMLCESKIHNLLLTLKNKLMLPILKLTGSGLFIFWFSRHIAMLKALTII